MKISKIDTATQRIHNDQETNPIFFDFAACYTEHRLQIENRRKNITLNVKTVI